MNRDDVFSKQTVERMGEKLHKVRVFRKGSLIDIPAFSVLQ